MIASPNFDQKLANRGFIQSPELFNIQRDRAGWQYPIIDEIHGGQATRFKAYKSTASKKYWWGESGKPDNVVYYHAPGIAENIKSANEVVFIAAGEPDLWTYNEAGIPNVITWFGENSVPATIAKDFQSLGVSHVIYAPDLDATGKQSAAKVRDALSGTGIHFECKQLPETLGKKADTNDLWLALNQDSKAFRDAIENAPELDLPLPKPKQPLTVSSFGNDETPRELIQDIYHGISARDGFTGRKWHGSLQHKCLHHDDNEASAYFNPETGISKCFACDSTRGNSDAYSPVENAEALGIDWKRYYPKKSRKRYSKRDNPAQPEELQPINIPILEADTIVNLRYVSEIGIRIEKELLNHRTILIKSPIATGKTSLVKKLIQHAETRMDKPRVLIITHLENLAADIGKRFEDLGFIVYNDYTGTGINWQAADRIVCSFDSLHNLSGHHFDIVAIDEFEQFIPHLWGGTMTGDEPVRAFQTLMQLAGSTTHFIALDAHLTTKTRRMIEAIRGRDVHTLRNDYRHEWGDLIVASDPYTVIERGLKAAMGADKPIVFLCMKNRSKVLKQLCLDYGFNEDDIVLINSDTSQRDAIKDFRQNINENLKNVKILITSPSLATGIDIQTPVHGVYGLFPKQPLTPTQMLQMLGRCRNAGERWVWVCNAENQDIETDVKALFARDMGKALLTAEYADFEAYNIQAVDTPQKQINHLKAAFTSDDNKQRQNLKSTFIAYAENEGYSIVNNYAKSDVGKLAYQLAKQAVSDCQKDLTLSSEAIAPDLHKQLKKDGKSTDETDAGLLRYLIEDTPGIEVQSGLYDLFADKRQRARLNRFIDLRDDIENLKRFDRHEAQTSVLLGKRSHLTAIRELVSRAIVAVFGRDGLDNQAEFSREQIETALSDFMNEYAYDIRTFIDNRNDLSNDLLSVFRRILNKVGIKLAYHQIMRDGKRFYLYFIDPEHLQMWRNLAHIGLHYRQLKAQHGNKSRDYLKRGIELSIIRDLSNEELLLMLQGDETLVGTGSTPEMETIPI
jgi:superfamily II DNA or RNA helicase